MPASRPQPGRRWSSTSPGPCPKGTPRSSARAVTSSARGIARAPCEDPVLVVLDEATSSLDTPSEALIQTALNNRLRGRTAFIIAHRLATVIDSDPIVVMDGGLIVQAETHTQLLADRDGL